MSQEDGKTGRFDGGSEQVVGLDFALGNLLLALVQPRKPSRSDEAIHVLDLHSGSIVESMSLEGRQFISILRDEGKAERMVVARGMTSGGIDFAMLVTHFFDERYWHLYDTTHDCTRYCDPLYPLAAVLQRQRQ